MKQNWKGIGSYSTVGLEFVLSILFGFLGGRWLDQKLDTHGWLTATGVGFGLAAAFRTLWRAARRATEEAERLDREEREARKRFHDKSSE